MIFLGEGPPKVVVKTGISGIFFGRGHQDSGKNWDLWDFFFGRDPRGKNWDLWEFCLGSTPKVVSKTGISGIFGGRDPQGSGKNWDLWDFFGGGTPKILVKLGSLGILFGKYPQGSIKNCDLLDFFGVGGKKWWLDSHKKHWRLVLCGGWTAIKPKRGGWTAMKPKGGGWTAKNTSKNTCYHMITCESHDKT